MEQELFPLAQRASECLDCLYPSGKLAEVCVVAEHCTAHLVLSLSLWFLCVLFVCWFVVDSSMSLAEMVLC